MSNGSKAHLGKVAYIDKDYGYAFGGFMGLLSPQEKIDGQYIHYALCTPSYKDYIKSLSDGANINNLKFEDLKKFPIPVPPLAEQKRIVKTLDEKFAKIDKLKTAAETNLKNASEIFNAELNSKLNVENENLPQGWEIKTLQELSIQYGEYGMSVPSTSFDGVRYLRITDITDEGTLNEELVSADVDVIDDFYKLQEGDILFARTGATVGKTFVYEDKYGECVFAGYLIRYRPNQKLVMPRFLFYVTHSPKYFEWIRSNQKAAAQPNISAKLYNAFQIPLPPLSEQKRIVAHLDKLSEKVKRLEEIYRRTIDDCEELKKSILKQVFEVET